MKRSAVYTILYFCRGTWGPGSRSRWDDEIFHKNEKLFHFFHAHFLRVTLSNRHSLQNQPTSWHISRVRLVKYLSHGIARLFRRDGIWSNIDAE